MTGFAAGLVIAGSVSAHAQTPDVSSTRDRGTEASRRSSSEVMLMQHALELAVRTGASELLNQMSRITRVPPFAQLNGQPHADGFELPGYGMFFYVRVPGMSTTILDALPYLMDLQQRQMQAGVEGRSQGLARPAAIPGDGPAPPVSPTDPVPTVSAADLDVLKDPDPHYVQAIRTAIIDTMLENSRSLRVQPDGYLTVAAREDATLNPLDPNNRLRTMLFTVRGSVLADYHQERLSLEEARKLVTVTTD